MSAFIIVLPIGILMILYMAYELKKFKTSS